MGARDDLQSLLSAAVELIKKKATQSAERLTFGDEQFRLIAQETERGWILILLQELPKPTCEEALRKRFGLTEREAQVAQLLAARYSNREIAAELGFTVYTAGRHTEHVLHKLGVCNRRDVAARLMDSNRWWARCANT